MVTSRKDKNLTGKTRVDATESPCRRALYFATRRKTTVVTPSTLRVYSPWDTRTHTRAQRHPQVPADFHHSLDILVYFILIGALKHDTEVLAVCNLGNYDSLICKAAECD